MSTIVLDTPVLVWWSSQPDRLSPSAIRAIESATDLAVSDVSWFEIAWLALRQRIEGTRPLGRWMAELSEDVRSIPITPRIAERAASLAAPFPGDPVDRIIYATAVEHGWQLVTKDERMHGHPAERQVTVW